MTRDERVARLFLNQAEMLKNLGERYENDYKRIFEHIESVFPNRVPCDGNDTFDWINYDTYDYRDINTQPRIKVTFCICHWAFPNQTLLLPEVVVEIEGKEEHYDFSDKDLDLLSRRDILRYRNLIEWQGGNKNGASNRNLF